MEEQVKPQFVVFRAPSGSGARKTFIPGLCVFRAPDNWYRVMVLDPEHVPSVRAEIEGLGFMAREHDILFTTDIPEGGWPRSGATPTETADILQALEYLRKPGGDVERRTCIQYNTAPEGDDPVWVDGGLIGVRWSVTYNRAEYQCRPVGRAGFGQSSWLPGSRVRMSMGYHVEYEGWGQYAALSWLSSNTVSSTRNLVMAKKELEYGFPFIPVRAQGQREFGQATPIPDDKFAVLWPGTGGQPITTHTASELEFLSFYLLEKEPERLQHWDMVRVTGEQGQAPPFWGRYMRKYLWLPESDYLSLDLVAAPVERRTSNPVYILAILRFSDGREVLVSGDRIQVHVNWAGSKQPEVGE